MYYAPKTYKYTRSSLGVTATDQRTLKSGREYDVLFQAAKSITKTVHKDANVYQVLDLMEEMVLRTLDQTKAITRQLQAESGELNGPKFYKALFDFVYDHIQYIPDEAGFEDLSEPAFLWANREHGGDCDCYAGFILSCLINAGVKEKYVRIIRLLDEKGKPKDYFQHVYVVVPKVANANMYDKQQYWVIDPVMDEFNQEPEYIVEQFDKPMVQVRVLSGLGNPENVLVDEETKALIAERNLIASGKSKFVCSNVNRQNAIAAIDYYLKYKNDPTLRPDAVRILQERAGQIFVPTSNEALNGWLKNVVNKIGDGINNVADNAADIVRDKADDIKDAGKKVIQVIKKVNPAFAAFRTAYRGLIALNVHGWATKWKLANQADPAAVRKFWEKWGGNYGDFMSAVNSGANKNALLGLNGTNDQSLGIAIAASVSAAVATATPIILSATAALTAVAATANKLGILPISGTPKSTPQAQASINEANAFFTNNPVSGYWDWAGGQNNGVNTGFHISANSLNAGDKIRITVTEGDPRYNGVWPILYMGADDGTYQESMATVAISKKSGQQSASGLWELVGQDTMNSAPPGSGMSTTTKVVLGVLGLTVVAGIAYVVIPKPKKAQKEAA
jgi:hypothetical protein